MRVLCRFKSASKLRACREVLVVNGKRAAAISRIYRVAEGLAISHSQVLIIDNIIYGLCNISASSMNSHLRLVK